MSFVVCVVSSWLFGALGMAFFTLLERKVLGYVQLRKGPNKVSVGGVLQPFADVIKLFTKEPTSPSLSNRVPFFMAPVFALGFALLLWGIYPHSSPGFFMVYGGLYFLCVSSLNVFGTLAAGWSANSKYALFGSLRGVAQTISYEVSMGVLLISCFVLFGQYNMVWASVNVVSWVGIMCYPLAVAWFISTLAETNRSPFDFVEGESELVSGFNVEYGAGSFALIFMAEYLSIIIMSVFSSVFFVGAMPWGVSDVGLVAGAMVFCFAFIWVRGSLPRLRYDSLMSLTWKRFLPLSFGYLIFNLGWGVVFMV